jgi:hypothetical protein
MMRGRILDVMIIIGMIIALAGGGGVVGGVVSANRIVAASGFAAMCAGFVLMYIVAEVDRPDA